LYPEYEGSMFFFSHCQVPQIKNIYICIQLTCWSWCSLELDSSLIHSYYTVEYQHQLQVSMVLCIPPRSLAASSCTAADTGKELHFSLVYNLCKMCLGDVYYKPASILHDSVWYFFYMKHPRWLDNHNIYQYFQSQPIHTLQTILLCGN